MIIHTPPPRLNAILNFYYFYFVCRVMLEMGEKTAAAWTAWWILTFSVSILITYIHIYYTIKLYHRECIDIDILWHTYQLPLPTSTRFIIILLLLLLF